VTSEEWPEATTPATVFRQPSLNLPLRLSIRSNTIRLSNKGDGVGWTDRRPSLSRCWSRRQSIERSSQVNVTKVCRDSCCPYLPQLRLLYFRVYRGVRSGYSSTYLTITVHMCCSPFTFWPVFFCQIVTNFIVFFLVLTSFQFLMKDELNKIICNRIIKSC
jgi:hypothetical protein